MKKILIANLCLLLAFSARAQYNYPATKTVDSSDTWHGITVHDPYRWLENLKDSSVTKWFKEQSDYTNSIVDNLPQTDELYKQMLMLDSIQPDKIYKIRQVGKTLFYFNLKLGEPKAKLFKRNGEFGKEELVAEPAMWGNNYNIADYYIEPFQKYLAISAGEGGKEKNVVKFYDIAKNKFLPDSIPGLFAGFTAKPYEILYMQQPSYDVHVAIEDKDKVFKTHLLGSDTLQDNIYLSYKTNPELYTLDNSKYVSPFWSDDPACKYEFIVRSSVSPYSDFYYRPLHSKAAWKKIISMEEDDIYMLNIYGNKVYMGSKKNAPNGKILVMDLNNPDIKKAKTIIPEKDIPLEGEGSLTQSKNFLIATYIKNGVLMSHSIIDMRSNKVSKNPFAESTNLTYLTPFNKDNDDIHIARTGWITPLQFTYANLAEPAKGEKKFSFRKTVAYPYVNELKVEEIEIPGHDGVMIPLSLVYRKDLKLNGKNPAYVYSYGAYGYSTGAGFSSDFLLMAHKGMIIAIAHVRGGGEKGENWHLAGYKQSKPNTWKDLNSCAEYLVNKGLTSPEHLSCEGGSAGGILIGRAITERPDLWACAVPQVGCLSMIRQEFAPNGPINTPEFGSVKNINEFFALMEMDATLHVQPDTKYPSMLITTGWNDPRVISWQPAKFAAAVQKANTSGKPTLLQVDYNGGHGDSEDKFAGMKKEAKKWAFILWQTQSK
ncbi:prolyl oligopeptidase family serine peptidase [Ferruginibacter lapsinanis]|uniref:prolyl oligopeptidase family serine peptidase n=1 Tax=Ferruginibacter lapsinanis TaxID=563172 RepID=UPI001E38A9D0|nr:prolyl oligopeptidase family serine peptidase [Ferruginibacter lapsinanis]UEG50034.1 prolyl oligopeptidase family serine peptidase [Ferruginibacter lapsinanis]